MDIIFNCRHCDQELSVDSAAAGSEIPCPSCGGQLVIPAAAEAPPTPKVVSAIATSAGAKEEKHFSVPVHDKPAESLITKALVPLDVAAKEAVKLRVKTIRHTDCVEVGRDHFDEVITKFLEKIGETHLVSITPITYSHQDMASREWVADYGVIIIYRG